MSDTNQTTATNPQKITQDALASILEQHLKWIQVKEDRKSVV